MTLDSLLRQHYGTFLCSPRSSSTLSSKTVSFQHVLTAPEVGLILPQNTGLQEVYQCLGSLLLYCDVNTHEAAKYLAPPGSWPQLKADFMAWLDPLDAGEWDEFVPSWIPTAEVIGEIPRSGNYILLCTDGPEIGAIYEFDHDGYEFEAQASDLVTYLQQWLKPDRHMLTQMAAHLTFVSNDAPLTQWWIEEMHDSHGYHVTTHH